MKIDILKVSIGLFLFVLTSIFGYAIYKLVALSWFVNAGFISVVIVTACIIIAAIMLCELISMFIKNLKETKK